MEHSGQQIFEVPSPDWSISRDEEKGKYLKRVQRANISHEISPQEDKIGEGSKGLINIKDTNGQDPSGSQRNPNYAKGFKNLGNLSIESYTIFKVNAWLCESNSNAYIPKMVSIGPYHSKNPQLHPMQKHKLSYLGRFLQRKEGLDEASCINELEKHKVQAMKCYEDIEDLNTDEFCKMLLLDGCFVVEFIRECCGRYPQKDKIIKINAHYIFRDLLLLENQLPFFVLDQLHDMTKQDGESPLAKLVSRWSPFCVDDLSIMIESFEGISGYDIKHLLHLVKIRSCHGNSKKKSKNNDDPKWHIVPHSAELSEAGVSFAKADTTSLLGMVMPNATELSEAGVSFAKADTTSLLGIKFENGSMTIPCFKVEDGTETILRNLIAFEQQSVDDEEPKYFSDFAIFMDHLIDSDKDVNLLRRKGIILNFIGEDKEVASLFNKIGSGVTMYPNFYYKKVFKDAAEYSEKSWNRMKANLKHNYFSSPWKGASTVAAIILLILTTIQTILAFIGPVKK